MPETGREHHLVPRADLSKKSLDMGSPFRENPNGGEPEGDTHSREVLPDKAPKSLSAAPPEHDQFIDRVHQCCSSSVWQRPHQCCRTLVFCFSMNVLRSNIFIKVMLNRLTYLSKEHLLKEDLYYSSKVPHLETVNKFLVLICHTSNYEITCQHVFCGNISLV